MIDISTWNTWNPKTLLSYVHPLTGFEIKIAVRVGKEFKEDFSWEDIMELGPHALDGRYVYASLRIKNNKISVEWAKINEQSIIGKICPLKSSAALNAIFILHNLYEPENSIIQVNPRGKILFSTRQGLKYVFLLDKKIKSWGLFSSKESGVDYLLKEGELPCQEICGKKALLLEAPLEKDIHFLIFTSHSLVDESPNYLELLQRSEEIMLNVRRQYIEEEESQKCVFSNENLLKPISRVITWNVIWDQKKKRPLCTVSRKFSVRFGGWVLFEWDTFFNALLASLFNKELTYSILKSILEEMTEDGFIPNYSCPMGKSEDRSQPPVGSYIVWKIYLTHPDKRFLSWTYPLLKRWHNWWLKARDGNDDGLLEWGTGEGRTIHLLEFTDESAGTIQAARFESGLDNSPMYDDVNLIGFTKEGKTYYTMNLIDVGLNSLYALDSWSLYRIANELGINEDAEHFKKEYEEMRKRIDVMLWSDNVQIYLNRYHDGKFSRVISPTNFYPLIAGIPSREKAHKMISRHLLNNEEFWNTYVIPSVSKDNTSFWEQNYWRGRIWGPMNFLVAEGLRRYEFDDVVHELALKSVNLFLNEWINENHIHENYNAITGDGDDVKNSDPVYTWGALLAYIGIQEVIDIEPWSGLRFGNYFGSPGEVKNYSLSGHKYDVKVSHDTLIVRKDGKELVRADKPVLIRNYRESKDKITLKAKGYGTCKIRIGGLEDKDGYSVNLSINNKRLRMKVQNESITVDVPLNVDAGTTIRINLE